MADGASPKRCGWVASCLTFHPDSQRDCRGSGFRSSKKTTWCCVASMLFFCFEAGQIVCSPTKNNVCLVAHAFSMATKTMAWTTPAFPRSVSFFSFSRAPTTYNDVVVRKNSSSSSYGFVQHQRLVLVVVAAAAAAAAVVVVVVTSIFFPFCD